MNYRNFIQVTQESKSTIGTALNLPIMEIYMWKLLKVVEPRVPSHTRSWDLSQPLAAQEGQLEGEFLALGLMALTFFFKSKGII